MSDLGAYTFLPWTRRGLGGQVQEDDQAQVTGIRASIPVTLTLTGELLAGGTATQDVPRDVELYGPGDILGVDAASIVRTEPRHWVTNFESNYLPFVEFYEEDFPWRYTPAKASGDGRRLRPWLTLVVLTEDEFRDLGPRGGSTLPVVEIRDPGATFPAFDDLWAWAHVHVNGALGGDRTDQVANAARLAATVAADRDHAYSRLLCPRALGPNTGYHAFLVPTFESGRLAGLAEDPSSATFPTQGAWSDDLHAATPFPVYHRWFFRTGEVGDFEYLVRLLKPRTVDSRVGRRPMDVLDPGAGLPPISGLGGVLRLGGALRAPLVTLDEQERDEYEDNEAWADVPYPHPFQDALADLVNLAVDDEGDPLVVPPLYGRWHSQVARLTAADADPALEHWVAELNHDPRHRAAAGLGTTVVQKHQERFMEAAWQQVGKVLEGNARIRAGQVALWTSRVWHGRELNRLVKESPGRLLTVTGPVHQRVLDGGQTVAHAVRRSRVPKALLGTGVRALLRPRSRATRLAGDVGALAVADIVERVNAGEISVAPPKTVPENLPTGPDLAEDLAGSGPPAPGGPSVPPILVDLLRRFPGWRRWLWTLAAALALMLLLLPGFGLLFAALVLLAAWWLDRWLRGALASGPGAAVLDPETRTPDAVDDLPHHGSFEVSGVDPTSGLPTLPAAASDGSDSAASRRFKEALRRTYAVDTAARGLPEVVRDPLDLPAVAAAVHQGTDPRVTVPRHVLGGLRIPERITGSLRGDLSEDFDEVMVYPEIDEPMYAPLEDLSSEYLVPNINLVEPNSITLLETNQKFIEAYLVGLNHELARELLWREYPTDQRGSYFRQFWDVRGVLAEPGGDPAALREQLRDVRELHRWSPAEGLGSFDNRELAGDEEDELVLAIRGELLKKYPTAVVYAHRATWARGTDGSIDRTEPRGLVDLPSVGQPGRERVRSPLYEAKVDPDITFFGFDLTAEDALGGPREGLEDDPGWFFVIKERPGEPRFGLDLPRTGGPEPVNTWNELSWTDVSPGGAAVTQLPVGATSVTLEDPGAGPEKQQHDEDKVYQWRSDTDAAELAYILYQVPVLIAVHAAEMLKKDG